MLWISPWHEYKRFQAFSRGNVIIHYDNSAIPDIQDKQSRNENLTHDPGHLFCNECCPMLCSVPNLLIPFSITYLPQLVDNKFFELAKTG